MSFERTTISVHPERRKRLAEVRDERELSNMDAALKEVLKGYD